MPRRTSPADDIPTTRIATVDDIPALLKMAPDHTSGEFEAAIKRPNALWIADDEGAFMQISLSNGPLLPTATSDDEAPAGCYVNPLYPLDETIGKPRLWALMKHILTAAWETWPQARHWPVHTLIPKGDPHGLAAAVQPMFNTARVDDPKEGGIHLSVPDLDAVYQQVQLWPK